MMATSALQSHAQNGKAIAVSNTFRRTTCVSINIQAPNEVVWALLTNAADFPRWNSTIVSMHGEIKKGGKVKLKSTLDSKRTFKLKVTAFEPERKMIWSDGMAPFFKGKRSYLLSSVSDGSTNFTMEETMSGLMFPLAAKSIPDFKESFEQYAADLKKEAEIISTIK
ncbi:MAG: SRPBCC domain-containing protein [Imperialibacter sp.]